jgi:guanine deaminase
MESLAADTASKKDSLRIFFLEIIRRDIALMKEDFMREAIRISLEMMRQGKGGPFGAVVVREGRIVGRGWNQVTSTNDPTAHAEIVAIRDACQGLVTFRLDDCELFASCEPCPMCLGAIYWARLRKVYFGALRSDAAQAGFMDDLIYKEIALPHFERKLACEQLMAAEAVLALAEWKTKADKILY